MSGGGRGGGGRGLSHAARRHVPDDDASIRAAGERRPLALVEEAAASDEARAGARGGRLAPGGRAEVGRGVVSPVRKGLDRPHFGAVRLNLDLSVLGQIADDDGRLLGRAGDIVDGGPTLVRAPLGGRVVAEVNRTDVRVRRGRRRGRGRGRGRELAPHTGRREQDGRKEELNVETEREDVVSYWGRDAREWDWAHGSGRWRDAGDAKKLSGVDWFIQ